MIKALSTSPPPRGVRDSHTGRTVEVYGLGGLKSKPTLREDIDLTKPIFEQVSRAEIPNATTRAAIAESRTLMKARKARFEDSESLIAALEQAER